MANPRLDTRSAAIITTARLGSQRPNRSRKASTFAGATMPEIRSPQPKMKPQMSPAAMSIAQLPNT
jgi:hypothetical protein